MLDTVSFQCFAFNVSRLSFEAVNISILVKMFGLKLPNAFQGTMANDDLRYWETIFVNTTFEVLMI